MATSSTIPTATPHEYGTIQEIIDRIIDTAQLVETLYDPSPVIAKDLYVVVLRDSHIPQNYRGLLLARRPDRMPSTYYQSAPSNSARQVVENLFETICEVAHHKLIRRKMVLDPQIGNAVLCPATGGLVPIATNAAPVATVAPQDLMREQ